MIEFEISTNKKQIDFDITQGVPKYVPANFQSKSITITENGTTEVVADSGYDGLAKVSVEANVKDKQVKELIEGTITEISNSEVTAIRDYTFYNYTNLKTAQFPNITSIGSYAFCYCQNLTSINIGNSVRSIGENAFQNCSSLTSIDIPNSVTSIGSYVFYNCSSLTSIDIPNSVTSIGSYVFYNCSSLTSIDIPNSVTSIGSYAFCYCQNLTSINIGNSVRSIGENAFQNCSSLTSITIPNSVTSIVYGAFYTCKNLTSINIGNSVRSIGGNAFYNCKNLSIVDFRSATQVPTVQSSSFNNVPTTCKFIIPDELYDSWIASTNWVSLYNKGYQFVKKSEYTEA